MVFSPSSVGIVKQTDPSILSVEWFAENIFKANGRQRVVYSSARFGFLLIINHYGAWSSSTTICSVRQHKLRILEVAIFFEWTAFATVNIFFTPSHTFVAVVFIYLRVIALSVLP